MKQTICILALFFTTTAFGQTKDRRAVLDIQGRVKEISVSQDEKIWLVTAIGNTYYTNNIDSNWHYGNPIFEKDENNFSYLNSPNLDRISFFNKDTAIMTGYISGNEKSRKSGYYFTKDAGNTWQLLDFGSDSWIYDVFVDKKGNAWIGGSSGEIFFSDDYGLHWKKLNSPYNSSSRMHSIFMTDQTNGISGALHNDIYITSNNWKSSKKVTTPLDQKKYNSDRGDDRIEKIILWNNFIVVNQNGHIYYTQNDKIDWQPFPVKIYDFELDKEANLLFAITDSLKVISLSSPTSFEFITDQRLSSFPLDLKVVNHSLFIVSTKYDVYKVDKNGLTYAIPYTTDKKIEEPRIVKKGKKLIWGVNGNQIYLAEDNKRDWYRENALEFNIVDFMLLNDSVAVLWDGIKDNYLYSLKDHTPQKYFPEFPLQTFLLSPVKSFSINSGTQGCFHHENHEVHYEKTKDSFFTTKSCSVGKQTSSFKNKVNENILTTILLSINSNPSVIPLLKDFKITEKDKQNYLTLIEERLKNKDYDFSSWKKKYNKDFYYSVPSMLDTLDNSVIQNILNQVESGWSTTSNWFRIQIVNENKDTLTISRDYYMNTLPWNLPWKFEYKGLHFNCYNIAFSQFINSCIPDNFMDKGVFNNSVLIMEIADYLWRKKE